MSNNPRRTLRDAAAPEDIAHLAQDPPKHSTASNPSQHDKAIDRQDKGRDDRRDDSLGEGKVDAPDEKEYGGQAGPDPTRYGDWEKKGRVSDF